MFNAPRIEGWKLICVCMSAIFTLVWTCKLYKLEASFEFGGQGRRIIELLSGQGQNHNCSQKYHVEQHTD